MRSYGLALMGLCACTFLGAQPHSTVPTNIRASATLNRLTVGGANLANEFVYGIPLPPGKIVGDPYLNAAWQRGSILLYNHDDLIEGLSLRYDIDRHEMEVNTTKGIRVIDGAKIRSFIWIDSITQLPTYFVNVQEYRNNTTVALPGFLEVLSDGKMPAFVQTSVSIKKPDYNVQLDVGKRDAEILKKKKYYYLQHDQLLEIPNRKKQFLLIFGEHQDEIDAFMKMNFLTIKDENHLRAIFDHRNALLSK